MIRVSLTPSIFAVSGDGQISKYTRRQWPRCEKEGDKWRAISGGQGECSYEENKVRHWNGTGEVAKSGFTTAGIRVCGLGSRRPPPLDT